jgi:hypothetical protein
MRHASIRLALTAALAMAGFAIASAQESPGGTKGHWLGKAEVEAKLSAAGYSVKRIKNGVGRYEVKAKGKDGKTAVLYVSPWTGEITGREEKH